MRQKIQELWLDTQEGDRLVERYQQDIRICKENGIPMVVMHLTGEFARFKDRIFAVHLHDNDKNEDFLFILMSPQIPIYRFVLGKIIPYPITKNNPRSTSVPPIQTVKGRVVFFRKECEKNLHS